MTRFGRRHSTMLGAPRGLAVFLVLLLAGCMKGPAPTGPQPTIVCSFKTHVCTPVTVNAEIMTDVR
jgi:hypothetical protein